MNDDDIAGIFDDLDPNDFLLTTSAVLETTYPSPAYPKGQAGEGPFNLFVEEQLQQTRYAFAASDGKVQPVAVMANATQRRMFTADDDETLGQFVTRLRREAKHMGAHWFYAAQITETLITEVDVSTDVSGLAADDVARANAAVEAGQTKPGLYWYAERREPGVQTIRQGIVEILNYKLGGGVETTEQGSNLYSQVLSG